MCAHWTFFCVQIKQVKELKAIKELKRLFVCAYVCVCVCDCCVHIQLWCIDQKTVYWNELSALISYNRMRCTMIRTHSEKGGTGTHTKQTCVQFNAQCYVMCTMHTSFVSTCARIHVQLTQHNKNVQFPVAFWFVGSFYDDIVFKFHLHVCVCSCM